MQRSERRVAGCEGAVGRQPGKAGYAHLSLERLMYSQSSLEKSMNGAANTFVPAPPVFSKIGLSPASGEADQSCVGGMSCGVFLELQSGHFCPRQGDKSVPFRPNGLTSSVPILARRTKMDRDSRPGWPRVGFVKVEFHSPSP